jgi:hypothetical protein
LAIFLWRVWTHKKKPLRLWAVAVFLWSYSLEENFRRFWVLFFYCGIKKHSANDYKSASFTSIILNNALSKPIFKGVLPYIYHPKTFNGFDLCHAAQAFGGFELPKKFFNE